MFHNWKVQSLGKSKTGDTVNINSIHVDINTQRKLLNLGFQIGEEVSVISGEANCSYLIETKNTQIMLDWDTVKKIRVKTGL